MVNTDFHGHDKAHNVLAEINEIRKYVSDDEINNILCVGVCCGYEAGLLSEQYPHAVVHAIEGLKETFDRYLQDDRSCCTSSVLTFNKVIAHYNGTVDFNLVHINTQHSILRWAMGPETMETRNVPCSTIERHCHDTGLMPDMLMIDLEGITARALFGAGPDLLSEAKVIMAETELDGGKVFHGGDDDSTVDKILGWYGFERILYTKPLAANEVFQVNSVWVKK